MPENFIRIFLQKFRIFFRNSAKRDSKKDTEKYKIYVTQREECIETVSTYEAEIAKHDEEISTASKGLQPHKDKISELGIRQSKFRTSHDAYQGRV